MKHDPAKVVPKLYAFPEKRETTYWGNCYQALRPKTPFSVVTHQYTPTSPMKRFQSADAQWLDNFGDKQVLNFDAIMQWIQKSNTGIMPATRLPHAVEGLISVVKHGNSHIPK
ncbi:hypothetical protein FISHEDRAFT_59027 [Fistulina hepatica ATCC 64428]|uniref:Uncharacterized protein n=1 Tax=Fistulina hepatica ATCC 64428 TaxID=1128425 RepID=A0A0D7ABI3_9AGAR|nr:hypothetical protein FISHEDRAFT_59027 [Fistulina hepatica ATCC 64428]